MSGVTPNWHQLILAQAKNLKASTYIPFAFGLLLLGIIWMRDWSKPNKVEDAATNPARAAVAVAATNSSEMLLPDRLNLNAQQLIHARAQQIKADIARETQDKRSRCNGVAPTQCLEVKWRKLNQQMSEAIGDDGSLKIPPARASALNAEAQAMLVALAELGARDDESSKMLQVYLPATSAGDGTTLSGLAVAVQGVDEYLERRKVDRLSASGKSDSIPERKGVSNVRSASALDR